MIQRKVGSVAEYPRPRLRAAVVQLEGVHEECVPALAHLLRLHGVEPTIYLHAMIRKRRPGFRKRFPQLADHVQFFDPAGRGWGRLMRRIRAHEPDLLVLNTFQHDRTARWASRWPGPMLGVVHNPVILRQSELSMELVRAGRIGLLTLAPHATADLMRSDPHLFGSVATTSMTFPRPPAVNVEPTTRRRIAVPGAVNFRARDHEELLRVLPSLRKRVSEPFEVAIVGGGADRPELERLVRANGAEDVFHFAPLDEQGSVSSGDYYRTLMSSDFLLPLLPKRRADFRTYKITSSVPVAVGLGVPMILDRWTATVYDVPAVQHLPDDLESAVVRALTMSDAERERLRQRVVAVRDRELERARHEVRYALSRIGLGSTP